ncbi:hypothetical protein CYMTET_40698 [Cymbomonas tetramitiformis]|uniref:DUF1622 domain-containing protein n=1 Tax=Cymbomonas tetramitiformis TaxID=36881 RepID=A0AAE0C9L1_9CHLO|nr:hypothetical protein CYMTET_40698 [Cymbomonas tetramitiformis]
MSPTGIIARLHILKLPSVSRAHQNSNRRQPRTRPTQRSVAKSETTRMRCGNPRDVASKAAASGDFALDGSDGGSGGGGGSGTSKKTGEESGDDDEEESFIEGMQKRICEFFGKFFENVALAIMVYKGLFALIYAWRYMCSKIDYDNDACTYWYDLTRITLGRGILLGLEFLLISDIIETMVHGANTTSLINIGLVAIIRTMIDFFMAKEIEEASHELKHLAKKKA